MSGDINVSKKSRWEDRYKEKLPDILVVLVFALFAWGIKLEVGRHDTKRRLGEIERQAVVRWSKINENEDLIHLNEKVSSSQGDRAEEAVDNMKKVLDKLDNRVFRLEGLTMVKKVVE